MPSKARRKNPRGIHEGVDVCIRELLLRPPLPEREVLDSLQALTQFILADSDDEAAAMALALPALIHLISSDRPSVRQRAVLTVGEICDELAERGKTLVVEDALVAELEVLAGGEDADRREAANRMRVSLPIPE